MPAAMHSFYLRRMYQENLLSQPGGITLGGVKIDLRKVKTPAFLLSTREDHIAPWRSTYAATQLYGGPVKFVLSASGHIAGVVNPPGSKYGHWTNDKNPPSPDEWLAGATAARRLVVAGLGRMGRALRRRRGAGAPARRRQADADRGRAGQLRQGAGGGLIKPGSSDMQGSNQVGNSSDSNRPRKCKTKNAAYQNSNGYTEQGFRVGHRDRYHRDNACHQDRRP